MQLELELGSGFEEGFVHGTKSRHLGHLLYARQVLRLRRVDQQDSKSKTEVDDRSHKWEVKEETNDIVLFHFSSAKVNHKLTQLEEERNEHEEKDSDGPSQVPVLPKLEKGEEVGGDIGAWQHRVGDNVQDALLQPHPSRHDPFHFSSLLASLWFLRLQIQSCSLNFID